MIKSIDLSKTSKQNNKISFTHILSKSNFWALLIVNYFFATWSEKLRRKKANKRRKEKLEWSLPKELCVVKAFKPLWCLACLLALMLVLPHSLYGNQAIYFFQREKVHNWHTHTFFCLCLLKRSLLEIPPFHIFSHAYRFFSSKVSFPHVFQHFFDSSSFSLTRNFLFVVKEVKLGMTYLEFMRDSSSFLYEMIKKQKRKSDSKLKTLSCKRQR